MNCKKFSLQFLHISIFLFVIFNLPSYLAAKSNHNAVLDDIVDVKEFKKLLRTKNNVLVCFVNSVKNNNNVIKVFRDSAVGVKGHGTMVLFDCSLSDVKKLCKKLKVAQTPYVIKHYKEGEFHKDYDRSLSVSSIINFMKDPTGDLPWDEDPVGASILHLQDTGALTKLLKRETSPIMIMFYAPWCGFCKQLKPDYAAAANELKGHSILAAIDVNKPENSVVRTAFNITGFPTLIYYENGAKKMVYEGDNKKESIVEFMRNPNSIQEKPKEVAWAETNDDIKFLTVDTFEHVVSTSNNILVMFYAPWCGHCKRMKPDYERAAARLIKDNVDGVLAAVDATKEQELGKKFNINGYPTMKFFSGGEFKFDIVLREEQKIVDFMKDPKEPPPPPPPEAPWSEQQSEVVHLTEENFKPFLKKKKHVLVMFYAPWCGHCKKAKPEYTEAAAVFVDDPKIEFGAVDCTIHTSVCSAYDVKGYPTFKLYHYLNKEPVVDYDRGRTKQDFVKFMSEFQPQDQNPSQKAEDDGSGEQDDWGNSDGVKLIKFLNENNIHDTIKDSECLLILFYTPWCGHCKRMKKDYSNAAVKLQESGSKCQLAAIDVSVKEDLAIVLDVRGFPTLKYYRKGEFITNYYGGRKSDDFVKFLTDPPKTPTTDKRKEEL